MKTVEIYTTQTCPFCHRAKALLTKKGVKFAETDVGNDASVRTAMTKRAGGKRSVPQIFIGGVHVGGCDDLYDLNDAGKLDAMLA
jgi:glutaredoxin 3